MTTDRAWIGDGKGGKQFLTSSAFSSVFCNLTDASQTIAYPRGQDVAVPLFAKKSL
jgi:hypothetical protein